MRPEVTSDPHIQRTDRDGAHSCEALELDPSTIRTHPLQPRHSVRDESHFRALVEDLREGRQYQPAVVSRGDDGTWVLVFGHARREAALEAGVKLRCTVTEMSEEDRNFVLGRENAVRGDWTPAEWAHYLRGLKDLYPNGSIETLAKRVGLTTDQVKKLMQVASLPEDLQEALRSREISAAHARTLGRIASPAERRALLKEIKDGGLSVRDVEALVAERTSREADDPQQPDDRASLARLVEELNHQYRRFGEGITIERIASRGRDRRISVLLSCESSDDLSRLLGLGAGQRAGGHAGAGPDASPIPELAAEPAPADPDPPCHVAPESGSEEVGFEGGGHGCD